MFKNTQTPENALARSVPPLLLEKISQRFHLPDHLVLSTAGMCGAEGNQRATFHLATLTSALEPNDPGVTHVTGR